MVRAPNITFDRSPSAVRAMRRFEKAAIDRSWIGSKNPIEHQEIEREYNLALLNLVKYLPTKPEVKNDLQFDPPYTR